MIRTQVYLPDDLYNELKFLSATGEDKFSDLIRLGAKKVIQEKRTAKKSDWKAWEDFIGAIKGGPKTNAVKDIQEYYETGVVK